MSVQDETADLLQLASAKNLARRRSLSVFTCSTFEATKHQRRNLMNNRSIQRIAGLVITLISAGFIVYTWRTALLEGQFSLRGSITFPAFLVLGVGMIIFPSYKAERLARGEDISQLKGMELITTRWWIIIATGMLASSVNYFLLVSF
jgi:hypothetical protein